MPVPTTFADLSTTAASNSPAGSENVFPSLDDYIRFINAALASIKANTATNGWVSPYIAGTGSWAIPGTIGSTTPNTGAFTTLSASDGSGVAALNATNLTSGTVPNARFPATLPAASAANLTNIPAANLVGTVPSASLTSVPSASLTGDIAAARMATAFLTTLGNNGSVTLPGGWIVKAGTTAHAGGASNVNQATSYTTAFPTAVVAVVLTDTNGVNVTGVTSSAASGFTASVWNRDPGSNVVAASTNWLAIGY